MFHVYVVTYGLTNPGFNSQTVIQAIKSCGEWALLTGEAYAIYTSMSPVQVRDKVMVSMLPDDKLYVGKIVSPAAWKGFPDQVTTWMQAKLR
jgi:hypothetical protein